ncbi:Dabb family protein [Rhizobium sp. SSA_523]|uniref:Dabb family protein n=1 Tax=Rhizobium sp. SSA_523 TaxID=2952477 RepID=UPI002090ED65|nr:Dabb family protein [Rhizobium sp. SSA_523]MCO5731042.1 Dabb family protein [Rhizobium sp. SSA_523]WKC24155.1 Dabb family protein [Rhizobium sp. SSA_523]
MILHCVFLRLKASLPATEKQSIYEDLARLQTVIPGIVSIKTGPNVSPEGLSGGFREGFVVTFEDATARDTYLAHPDHTSVGDRIVAACDGGLAGLLVFDLEV